MRQTLRNLFPVIILFTFLSAMFVVFSSALQSKGFDIDVLIYSNIILLAITLLTYSIQLKSLNNKNPNVFVRSVMGGMMLKMFICVIAVFLYVNYAGTFNKRSILAALFLYLAYLAVEVSVMMKLNKRKNA